jgi:ribosomal protein S18 acetylase RimI-like enzyme
MSDIEEQRFGRPGAPTGSIGLAEGRNFDRVLAWTEPGLSAGYPTGSAAVLPFAPVVVEPWVEAPTGQAPAPTPGEWAVELRDAVEADDGAIAGIEAVSFEPGEETFSIKRVRGLIANPRVFTSVALIGGQVVGWSAGLIRRHERGLSGRVYAVAIAPDARRRGIGRRLTLGLLERMRDAGANRVYLETRRNNAAAIELYRKLGFVSHRYLANYYGRHRHGLRMRLELV